MLQQNRVRNQNSVQYNGDTYQDTSLMQQHRTTHRMAQSNYMETTAAQHMYENGHENTTAGGGNQYQSKCVDNIGNDDSNIIGDDAGGPKRSSPGFETFVMTGDMIIRTSTPDGSKKTSMQKKRKPTSQGQHQVGPDGDSNKHKMNEKSDPSSGVPKKKVSKIPQSKIPKSGTPIKDKTKEKTKSPVSRIPKMASSLSGGGGSRESSPKSSPKNSPKKAQSKLPQLQGSTVRSPVLSDRQQSSSAKQSVTTPTDSSQRKPLSPRQIQPQSQESFNNNVITLESGTVNENNQSKELDLMDVDPNGSTLSTSKRTVPHTPSLSPDVDYSSFCVVPQASPSAYPELDIPPDDITSEDVAYQNIDAFVNLEDLPPPPDDLLCDASAVDKNGGFNDVDQVVPEVGGFLPIYSPSEITRQNQFRLDSAVLQSTNDDDTPQPVADTVAVSRTFADNELTSQAPIIDALPASPGSRKESPGQLEEEQADAEPTAEPFDTETEIQPKVDSSQALGDHSYSMPPQETNYSYEENCINRLEHGAENDLEMKDSAYDVQGEPVCPSEREIITGKPTSSRIPVIKPSSASSVSGVRNSKSHENYLESSNVDPSMQCVDIDFEDDIATSVDVLHYQEQSAALCAERQSKSLDNSPERGSDKHSEKILMPTFINIEEPRSIGKLKEGGRLKDMAEIRQSVGEPKVGYHTGKSSKDKNAEVNGANCISDVTTFESVGESSTDPEETVASAQTLTKEPILEKCDDGIWLSIGALKDALSATSSPQHSGANSDTTPQQHQVEINYSGASKNLEDCKSGQASHSRPSPSSHQLHVTSRESTHSPPQEQQVPDSSPGGSPSRQQAEPDDATDVKEDEYSTEDRLLGGAGAESDVFGSAEVNDSDTESIYHQPVKDVDRPSAERLAKRLYNLEGFKKSDISKHLSKKNDFAQLVGEEYLRFFDFRGMTLDTALRDFLKHLTIAGETQERERVLAHFSHGYMQMNPSTFNSDDACHTLTCALMLLNTDHHGQNIGRKMTLAEFIENLAELNDGENFPKEVLRHLYHSIKDEKLECEFSSEVDELALAAGAAGEHAVFIGANPFLEVPNPSKAVEYRKGYVMRKCCNDPDGRKTPIGKRGWKMFYAVLRDMVLYLHKNEKEKKTSVYNNVNNAIRIHHALATKATNYTKKAHVFRLQTADWAEYLFETSDVKECQAWMDTINLVAASLSAPPLPGAVGSQRKFQRPLMPSSYTRLNLTEQLQHHEQRVAILEKDLHEHRLYPPEKGSKSRVIQDYTDKETCLQFELKRFKTYSFLLQSKMAAFPELEPSLVEIAIGEVDEPSSPPSPEQEGGTSSSRGHQGPVGSSEASSTGGGKSKSKSSSRSVTDRYSYRAAIYKQDGS